MMMGYNNRSFGELVEELELSSQVLAKRLQPRRLIPSLKNKLERDSIERINADRKELIGVRRLEGVASSLRIEDATRSSVNLKLPKLPDVVTSPNRKSKRSTHRAANEQNKNLMLTGKKSQHNPNIVFDRHMSHQPTSTAK